MKINSLHHIVATAVVASGNKFLLLKRSDHEEIMPGLWSVPGGKIELGDYLLCSKNTPYHWHNVAEIALIRECKEEIGIGISQIKYLRNVSFLRPDNIPTLVLCYTARYDGGVIKLSSEHSKFVWATLTEARKYKLIDGLYEELCIADSINNN